MPAVIASKVVRALPGPVQKRLRRARAAVRRSGPAVARTPEVELPPRPPLRQAPVRLLVGPANFAGQGWAWGRAVERAFPDVASQVFAVDRGSAFGFPADYTVDVPTYRSARWGQEQERYVLSHFTHVMIEAERPILGIRYGEDCESDAKVLAKAGLAVAMLSHGSDIRLPSRHVANAEKYPYSPFADPDWDLVPKLEAQAARFGRIIGEHDGPTFVSTPDLLDDAPKARWLPAVVNLDSWAASTPVLERERPLVLHAPSNTRFKGTEIIEPIVERLAAAGLIDYRRIQGIPNAELPALFARADVVLDQFLLGIYSVAALETMAAGRVCVAHVAPHVREHVREVSGEQVPVVEATVDTLAEVLERIAAERDWAREQAAAGVEFVRTVHDGRLSARLLGPFLGQG